jgi:hypothetical protein
VHRGCSQHVGGIQSRGATQELQVTQALTSSLLAL